MTDETIPDNTNPPPPPRLPRRFWIMIDFGLMTIEAAKAEWAKCEADGEAFDPLG